MVVEELGDAALLICFCLQRLQVLRHEIGDVHHWLDLLLGDAIGVKDAEECLQPMPYALRPFQRHPSPFLDHCEFYSCA